MLLFGILGLGFCDSFLLVLVGLFALLCWSLGKAVQAAAGSPEVQRTGLETLWNWFTGK